MHNLCSSTTQQPQDDEFERYITASNTPFIDWKKDDLFRWWMDFEYSQLRQLAFDTLSIPAMSAELERVFSQAKRYFTDDRNRLAAEQFEMLQCLKQWSLQEVYSVLPSHDLGRPE
jgi:hAT family C-terminal dimerisation region